MPPLRQATPARRAHRPAAARLPGAAALALAAALAANWLAAAAIASTAFSWISLGLFLWLVAVVARASPRAAILLAPVIITRGATLLSLMFIEAGAYMPEINRAGAAGDASASFVLFTAVFFLVFVAAYRLIERPVTAFARSPLLEAAVALAAWPIVLVLMAWGALAFVQGAGTGFPLLEGVDRFFYRRYEGGPVVQMLLDGKFLIAALLGGVAFRPTLGRHVRAGALAAFLGLTGLYFLFGDKFFTILTEVAFFLMPFLLPRADRLGALLLKGLPVACLPIALAGTATFWIYSDYGRRPMDRTLQALGERMAGQGELWFVASRDFRRATDWDAALVHRYGVSISDSQSAVPAYRQGVETYYFIQRYAPAALAASFRRGGGWVQLTMGYEAMALVMFGYVGVAVLMAVAGLAMALAAAYLARGFAAGFPISLFFAGWTYQQVYFAIQQASLYGVAAPGQLKRFLLFATIEVVLMALNRAAARPLPQPRFRRMAPR